MPEQLVGTIEELGPGSVRGIGDWAVLNVNGERYAVSRRCRHLREIANFYISAKCFVANNKAYGLLRKFCS